MSTSIALQAPIIGSGWPSWDPKTFLEVHFRSRALKEGFSVAWDDTAPKGVHTFFCNETPTIDGVDSCPYAWTIACDPKTGDFHTTSAVFTHAHPPAPADSDEREEVIKEHGEFLVEAIADLEETATARFDQLRKLSSYRIGLESLPGPSHARQQQIIVLELSIAVGQMRARRFELKMRLEDRLVDDYPTASTFDGPPQPVAPLEPVRRLAPAEAVASTSLPPLVYPATGAAYAPPSFGANLPLGPSRTAPPPPRPRSLLSSSSSARPPPLVFPDWWQFEKAVDALASSQDFQVAMCEVEVDDDVLALGCTEPGCTWRVSVAPASGTTRVLVQSRTCYEHRHLPLVRKRKAAEKASGGGSTKGKGLVKADKKKKKQRVSFKEPTPPLSPAVADSTPHKRQNKRRKATKAPVVEDEVHESDEDGDYVFSGKPEPDDSEHAYSSIVKPPILLAASPSLNPSPGPSSRPALFNSTFLAAPTSSTGGTNPPVGSVHAPATFYGSTAASTSSAVALEPMNSLDLVGGLSGPSGEQLGEGPVGQASGAEELDVKDVSRVEKQSAGGGAGEAEGA
ncbi:hypothetical protein JCM8208_005150 [Rhodotorula glutinis]